MGILDVIKHNKIKEPIFYNEHEDLRIKTLDELLMVVGDDQKAIIEEEKKYVQIGLSGEKNVIYELKRSKYPLIFLHDVTIQNGFHDSQIDFIVITRSGLLVLETKKLIGDIRIDNEGNFTRFFKNSKGEVYKKEAIYSPITQNEYHVNALRKLFDENKISKNIPIYPLVVIANSKTIIDKKYATKEVKNKVIKYDQLNNVIYNFIENGSVDISDNKMAEIAEVINNNDTMKTIDYISKLKLVLVDEQPEEDVRVIDETTNNEDYHLDDELYEKLREYRLNKAKELNVQAWIIFNNDTLSKLVLNKPKNKEEFLAIPGFGENKFEKYGNDILSIINHDYKCEKEIVEENKNIISDDIKEALCNKLKQYRYNKAMELKYKPYFIFNNAELDEIIKVLPTTAEELLKINGFGEKKVELYGKDIIDIISSLVKNKN